MFSTTSLTKKTELKLEETLDNLEKLVKERTAKLQEAYNSLKKSEKGLAEAQRTAHIGNWEWNVATGESHWSDEMYRIFGPNPQELSHTHDRFSNNIHPDDREYVESVIRKALNEKPCGIDYRIITANRKKRIVHA